MEEIEIRNKSLKELKKVKPVHEKSVVRALKELKPIGSDFFQVSQFNMAGYDLETMAILLREAQIRHLESLRDPSLLIDCIESLRHALVLMGGVVPMNIVEKLDNKLKKLEYSLIDYFKSFDEIDLIEIINDERYIELREDTRDLMKKILNLKAKYGLGIPTKITPKIQQSVMEAVLD